VDHGLALAIVQSLKVQAHPEFLCPQRRAVLAGRYPTLAQPAMRAPVAAKRADPACFLRTAAQFIGEAFVLHIRRMKSAPTPAAAETAASAAATPDPKSLNEQASEASEPTPAQEVPVRYADADLVDRVRNGDPDAFRTLFNNYHRRAFAVALGVVKNKDDALDVMQEAFIKVHKHIGSFQGTSSFYTWLYRIVMNLAIDHVRRTRKVVEFDDTVRKDDVAGDGSTMPRHPLSNPGKVFARMELSTRIAAALDELPEYHRAVIMLREVEGLSYEEMAKVLRVPKGTIMSRLFHARRKMQERLQGYLEGDLEITE
jgi:RNA polymerase sigma-70 factor (ECF subfamily)